MMKLKTVLIIFLLQAPLLKSNGLILPIILGTVGGTIGAAALQVIDLNRKFKLYTYSSNWIDHFSAYELNLIDKALNKSSNNKRKAYFRLIQLLVTNNADKNTTEIESIIKKYPDLKNEPVKLPRGFLKSDWAFFKDYIGDGDFLTTGWTGFSVHEEAFFLTIYDLILSSNNQALENISNC